jgi:hypothetical protein
MNYTTEFNQILELMDNLSLIEQDDIINIVRRRQIEKRREEIAANIAQSQIEYEQGDVFRGDIDDIIAELNK